MSDENEHISIARGVELIKRANRAIETRKYSGRPGGDWFSKHEFAGMEPRPTCHGIQAKAVLYATESGAAYEVHVYSYSGAELHSVTRKSLDAAFRVGRQLADGGE